MPVVVSAIVSKLLAKTAEERYQTAAGVESDLRRCLAQWELERRIEQQGLAHSTSQPRRHRFIAVRQKRIAYDHFARLLPGRDD